MTPLTFCLALAACVALVLIIIVSPDIRRALRKWKARRLHERAMRERRAGMECSDGEDGAA